MISSIFSKFHEFSMTGKWYLEYPGFPGIVGNLLLNVDIQEKKTQNHWQNRENWHLLAGSGGL